MDHSEPETFRPAEIVAKNLREARLLRGWTQEKAAEELEPYLGVRWSKSSFSAAENSEWGTNRWREFTAKELVAFSRAFGLPVAWFFLPVRDDRGRLAFMDVVKGDDIGFIGPEEILMDLVFMNDQMQERVGQLYDSLSPERRYLAGREFQEKVDAQLEAVLRATLGDIGKTKRELDRFVTLLNRIEKEAARRGIRSGPENTEPRTKEGTRIKKPGIGRRKDRSHARTRTEEG